MPNLAHLFSLTDAVETLHLAQRLRGSGFGNIIIKYRFKTSSRKGKFLSPVNPLPD